MRAFPFPITVAIRVIFAVIFTNLNVLVVTATIIIGEVSPALFSLAPPSLRPLLSKCVRPSATTEFSLLDYSS